MAGGDPALLSICSVVSVHGDRGAPDSSGQIRGSIGARSPIFSGGVACNSGLRAAASIARVPYPVFFPQPAFPADNAAMIAAAAFPKFAHANSPTFTLRAQANLALA